MQKVFFRLLLLSLSVCMFSCQSNRLEDDVDILEPTGGTGKTYTMYLDATYPSFVGDDADATTRAQNNSWENGDVIYVSFLDGNTHKIGEGKYKSSTGKWTVKLDNGSLTERVTYPCSVYYLCDGTVSRSGDAISVDEFTAVYADMSAIYSVSQDEIGLTASLKSQTWRMAFKGEVGTEVTVLPESSIQYVTKIDMSQTGSSSIQYSNDKAIDLTVQSTGKTPYIYGVFDSNDNNASSTLSLTTNQFPYYQFSRSIAHQSLQNGESGIVTMPTNTSNDDKWTSTLVEDVAVLLDGKDFNSAIKTLAADKKMSWNSSDSSIEYIVFETNSYVSEGTIVSSFNSPKVAYANYSPMTKTITITTQAEEIKTPKNFSYAFTRFSDLLQINGLGLLDTGNMEDMEEFFSFCYSLRDLDLSRFNTRQVKNMAGMFAGCSLQSLDLSNFDTYNVTNMSAMFAGCSLQSLDLSNFDTYNVTNMSDMFASCSLQSLDLSNFDTYNVTDMSFMFLNCSFETLRISSFNTHNVTNMSSMFENCRFLQILDVSNFDTHNVTNMEGMFADCFSLQTLDVSNFDTHNVKNMSRMFDDLRVQDLNVSNFDTHNVTNMSKMFEYCKLLQCLDLSNFDTHNVSNTSWMFSGCSLLQILDVSSFDTHNVTDMSYMFYDCSYLRALNIGNFDTENVADMVCMFGGCSSLQTLDVSNFDTRNVTDMRAMFSGCSSLQTLDVSNFDTRIVTSMYNIFNGCSSLQTLDVSSFDTQNVTGMDRMFNDCSSLQTLDVSSFDTQNVTDMSQMFSSCLQLKNLDLRGFKTNNVTSMRDMFENCQSLETLNLDGFSTESITWIGGMFYQCFALKQLYLGSSFILDKNASYDNYSLIVSGLAENSKECRISCPTVTKEFFLWMGIESKYIEWEILD